MGDLVNNKKIYTVKQVNYYIKQLLEGDFILRNVAVSGEISNCKYHHTGHIYFSLKDESGVLSGVMFASNAASLKMRLTDGMKVVVTGTIGVYEASGRYQIYAKKIEEAGKGDLYKQFEELKERLSESGMFAPEYKSPIPKYSMKIGVVTAETGAVIRDIFNVASRRNPYAQIFLYPSLVQGDGAATQIVRGIETLDKMGLDCIIVGRGGGSIEDLWCFNEEIVARAIFNCETPVISAVGHETDFTIADFVADLRAPTPSAAAELAVFDYNQFEKDLADIKYSLNLHLNNKLSEKLNKIKTYELKIQTLSPENQLFNRKERLKEIEDRLAAIMDYRLKGSKEKLALLSERLNSHSPLKRLSEGYAFVRTKGKPLKSISQVVENDEIRVNVTDGVINAVVKSKEDGKYE